jgi:DNA-binding response OmpR family regulator
MAAILLIDDDPDMSDAMSLVLEAEGYTAVSADTADIALREARRHAPLLTLVDYTMPGVDVPALIKTLRSLSPGTKIILCTAIEGATRVARDVGADGVLSKPFSMDDLLALVRAEAEQQGSNP